MRKNINKKQFVNWWLIGALAIIVLLLLFGSQSSQFPKAQSEPLVFSKYELSPTNVAVGDRVTLTM